MEDVTSGMSKPCLADIKIGRVTWDPFSSVEKQAAENVIFPLLILIIQVSHQNLLKFGPHGIDEVSRNEGTVGFLHSRYMCL